MGIYIQEMTPDLAKAFGETAPRGALVGHVTPGSQAEKKWDLKRATYGGLDGNR